MSHIVAIAGGSGGLGRTLVDAFKNSTYKLLILARKSNSALEKETGVPVLEVDYNSPSSMTTLLETHKIDTIISAISNFEDSQATELNLISAASQSAVTKRYIPSVWSAFDYTEEQAQTAPFAASRKARLDAMRKTDLEWTAIFPGIFLDYYTLTRSSHFPRTALGIDIDNNAASIPGDGNVPMYFTHTVDVAKYTVALLGLPRWEQKYFLYADKKTWNEVIALVEKAKGVKFDVAYDSVEKLKRGEITELPGHKAVYELFGGSAAKPMFEKLMAGVSVFMAEGSMKYEKPLLNEIFPGIGGLTVEEALGIEKT